MKAYQDKKTKKWKWGTSGKAIHETKRDAEKYGINLQVERLRKVKEQLNKSLGN